MRARGQGAREGSRRRRRCGSLGTSREQRLASNFEAKANRGEGAMNAEKTQRADAETARARRKEIRAATRDSRPHRQRKREATGPTPRSAKATPRPAQAPEAGPPSLAKREIETPPGTPRSGGVGGTRERETEARGARVASARWRRRCEARDDAAAARGVTRGVAAAAKRDSERGAASSRGGDGGPAESATASCPQARRRGELAR